MASELFAARSDFSNFGSSLAAIQQNATDDQISNNAALQNYGNINAQLQAAIPSSFGDIAFGAFELLGQTKELFSRISAVKNAVAAAPDAIKAALVKGGNKIAARAEEVKTLASETTNELRTTGTDLVNTASDITNRGLNVIGGAATELQTTVNAAANETRAAVTGAANQATEVVTGAANEIQATVNTAATEIPATVTRTADELQSTANTAAEELQSTVNTAANDLQSTVRNTVSNTAAELQSTASSAASSAASGFSPFTPYSRAEMRAAAGVQPETIVPDIPAALETPLTQTISRTTISNTLSAARNPQQLLLESDPENLAGAGRGFLYSRGGLQPDVYTGASYTAPVRVLPTMPEARVALPDVELTDFPRPAVSLRAPDAPSFLRGDLAGAPEETIQPVIQNLQAQGGVALEAVQQGAQRAAVVAQNAATDVVSAGQKAANQVINTGQKAANEVVNTGQKAANEVVDTLAQTQAKGGALADEALTAGGGAAQKVADTIANTTSSGAKILTGATTDVAETAAEIGSSVLPVIGEVTALALGGYQIYEGFKDLFDHPSAAKPVTVAMPTVANISQGFQSGI